MSSLVTYVAEHGSVAAEITHSRAENNDSGMRTNHEFVIQ